MTGEFKLLYDTLAAARTTGGSEGPLDSTASAARSATPP